MSARRLSTVVAALALLALAGCGFHLRRSAQLPAGMQRVYLDVHGGSELQRELAQSLRLAGSQVLDAPQAGAATLTVARADFRTNALTVNGYARISEYAIRLHVVFLATGPHGRLIAPRQSIDLAHEFTYDATQTIGSATQTEELQRQMRRDAVQAIMLRLQAEARHPGAALKAQSRDAADSGGDNGG